MNKILSIGAGMVLAFVISLMSACGGSSGAGDASPVQTTVAAAVDIAFVNVPTESRVIKPGEKDREFIGLRTFCNKAQCRALEQLVFEGEPTDDLSAFTGFRFTNDGVDVNSTEASYDVQIDVKRKQVKVNFSFQWTPSNSGIVPQTHSLIGTGDPAAAEGATLTLHLKDVQSHDADTTMSMDVKGGQLKIASVAGEKAPTITTSSRAFSFLDVSKIGTFVTVGYIVAACPKENINVCALTKVNVLTQGALNPFLSVGGFPIGFDSASDGFNTYVMNGSFGIAPGQSETIEIVALVTDQFIFTLVHDTTWVIFGKNGEQTKMEPEILDDSCSNSVSKPSCQNPAQG